MDKPFTVFPLIADDEPVITPIREMQLYDTEDLIMNIHGVYRDKDYQDVTRDFQFVKDIATAEKTEPERVATIEAGKSYAEKAREEAKRDVKQKRQAYLTKESKPQEKLSHATEQKPVTIQSKAKTLEELTGLAKAAAKLQQENYILAELPRHYKQPDNVATTKPKKNNYDFLKKSQIYNYQENQTKKERQIAQELNLTRFD